MTIAVLDHGSGNLRSVANALARVGADAEVTADPERAMLANGVVLPGVGHFGAGMAALRERGLAAVVEAFVVAGRPVFGVCLGMQMLFERSEEAPGVRGLGVFEGAVRRLPEDARVPHMGWSKVGWRDEPLHPYVADIPFTWFAFAHSYAAWLPGAVGVTPYGGRLIAAAVARDSVFATQFHPERSGRWGLKLYEAFVREAER